jgi:hypothetical protein
LEEGAVADLLLEEPEATPLALEGAAADTMAAWDRGVADSFSELGIGTVDPLFFPALVFVEEVFLGEGAGFLGSFSTGRVYGNVSFAPFTTFGRHDEPLLHNIERLPPTFREMNGVCDPTILGLIPLNKPKFLTVAIRYDKLRGRRKTRVGSLRLAMT